MITKILSKVYIHPLVYVIGIMSIITGLFKSFIMMYFIVIFHEIGHNIFLCIFKYNILSINIYPFGGITKIDSKIDYSYHEFLVCIGGILFQFILLVIFNIFIDKSSYIYSIFISYNNTIMLFNLIPIIPLDGAKALNILLNIFIPYKLSHKLSIYISYIIVLILFISYKDLNMILMSILLILLIIKEHKNHLFIFNTFVLNKYLSSIKFKNNNIINGFNKKLMMKYKNNIFRVNNKYVSEKEIY